MSSLVFNSGYFVPGIVGSAFLLLLFLETLYPLRQRKHPLAARIPTNLCFSGLVIAVGAYIVTPVALSLAAWTARPPFGLLHIIPLSFGGQFILGFLLMDLTFYYWHRVNHVFSFFRRFHRLHHIDPDLDVTTSFRFHFMEILYSTGFRVLQVGLIGISPVIYVSYELIFQYATMFHHSNVCFPVRIERYLNKIFVTPRMHGIHHSTIKAEMNSNYSVIFRWWDTLNGSLRLNISQSDINIGIAGYQSLEDNRFWRLLILPFRKQREYWQLPDGNYPVREQSASTVNPSIMLD